MPHPAHNARCPGLLLLFAACGAEPGPLADRATAHREPAVFVDANVLNARMGQWMAAGDFNGDGYTDIVAFRVPYLPDVDGTALAWFGGPSGVDRVPAWNIADNPNLANFGTLGAGAGDVNGDGYEDLLISDPYLDGARGQVVLLAGSPDGPQHEPAWTLTGSEVNQRVGVSIAAAGDVNGDGFGDVVIGTDGTFDDVHEAGQASVYLGGPDGLGASPAWTWSPGEIYANAGRAVAGAGDVNGDGFDDVLVGVPYQGEHGSAALFGGQPDGLTNRPTWTTNGDAFHDEMGRVVASAGDVNGDGYADLLIGTVSQQVNLYYGGPDGALAAPAQTLKGSTDRSEYGRVLAPAGDVDADGFDDVLVGARLDSVVWQADGAAWLYFGSAQGFVREPEALSADQQGAFFGTSIARAGDVNGDGGDDFVVGAPGFDNGHTDEGEFYLFLGTPPQPPPPPPPPPPADTASPSADSMAPADPLPPAVPDTGCGCASTRAALPWPLLFLFWRRRAAARAATCAAVLAACTSPPSGSLPSTGDAARARRPGTASPIWSFENDEAGAVLGSSVAGGGDVNGDGFADVLAGAPRFGDVVLFHGSAAGLPAAPSWAVDDTVISGAGGSVAFAGDVNADGFDDVVLSGVLQTDNDQTARLHLFLGSADGLTTVGGGGSLPFDGLVLTTTVAGAGDLNGDGFDDVVLGATSLGVPPSEDPGTVAVYAGTPTGISDRPVWVQRGRFQSAYFGAAVASAGDVNGDGFDDLIVGEDNRSNTLSPGNVFVFHGSAEGPQREPASQIEDPADEVLGRAVAGAGDVNGDGYDDVLMGAPGIYESDAGRADLYLGSADGLELEPAWTVTDDQANAAFGWWVASAGDLNGDGLADVVVGAPEHMILRHDEGRIFVYLTEGGALSTTPAWTANSGFVEGELGWSVAGAGDVDGDGMPEIVAGARGDGHGQVREGRVMLYDGLVDTGLDAPPEEPPPEVEPDTPEPEDSGVGPREDAGPAPEDTGGCQCAAASSGPSPWPLLLVGALLARRRSRIPSGSPW